MTRFLVCVPETVDVDGNASDRVAIGFTQNDTHNSLLEAIDISLDHYEKEKRVPTIIRQVMYLWNGMWFWTDCEDNPYREDLDNLVTLTGVVEEGKYCTCFYHSPNGVVKDYYCIPRKIGDEYSECDVFFISTNRFRYLRNSTRINDVCTFDLHPIY